MDSHKPQRNYGGDSRSARVEKIQSAVDLVRLAGDIRQLLAVKGFKAHTNACIPALVARSCWSQPNSDFLVEEAADEAGEELAAPTKQSHLIAHSADAEGEIAPE